MKFHDSDSSAMTPYNNAARLIQEGFLSVAERLSLSDCFPIEILKNAQEKSITNFWLDGFLDVQRLRLWMDTLVDLFQEAKMLKNSNGHARLTFLNRYLLILKLFKLIRLYFGDCFIR